MTHIERLNELLRRYVGFDPDAPAAPEHGLCANCMWVYPLGSDDAEEVLREAIIKPITARWPGFSGDWNYPVEGSGAYWRYLDKYNPATEHGRARRDLRLFIIAELQHMLEDETGLQPGLHSQPGGRATEDKA
jgi:hypothetical protein